MILSLIIIVAVIILTYRQHKIHKSIRKDVVVNSKGIEELESFTYHDKDEIKDWIDDGTRDIQYDLDEHASKIEDLDYTIERNSVTMEEVNEAIEESHDKLKKAMNEDFENVGVLIDSNREKIRNITAYLSSTTSDFKKTLDDSGNPKSEKVFNKEKSEARDAEHAMKLLSICSKSIHNNELGYNISDMSLTYKGEEYTIECLNEGDSNCEIKGDDNA